MQFLLFTFLLNLFVPLTRKDTINKKNITHKMDTIRITCVFRTSHTPDQLPFVPFVSSWRKDFQNHLYLPDELNEDKALNMTRKRVDDSTWLLQFQVPAVAASVYQPYKLSGLFGASISVFIHKNDKGNNYKIYMDTLYEAFAKYKVTAGSVSKFSFGIDLENCGNFPYSTDTAQIAINVHKATTVFMSLRKKYGNLISADEAFRKFVDMEILWKAYNICRSPYRNTTPGKNYLDSLKAVFCREVKDGPVIYSRASTLLGTYWLGAGIEDRNNIDSLLYAVKFREDQVPKGLYSAFLIEDFFASYVRNEALENIVVDKLYAYSVARIKDPYLIWSLNESRQEYINKHQALASNLSGNAALTTSNGDELTLERLFDLLKKAGKRRVVLDFWASWCGPCKQEIAASGSFLDSLKKAHSDFDYIYLNIDVPEKYKLANQFAKEKHFSGNNYFLKGANQAELFKYFRITEIPYHLVIDLHSKKFADIIGPQRQTEFGKAIEPYLADNSLLK